MPVSLSAVEPIRLHMAASGADASRADVGPPISALSPSSVPCRRYSHIRTAAMSRRCLLYVMPVLTSPGQHSGVADRTARNSYPLLSTKPMETFCFRVAECRRRCGISRPGPLEATCRAFSPRPEGERPRRLNCYHRNKARIVRLGGHRIEVRFDAPFNSGRSRLNCTLPGPDNRWRWFGRQFCAPERLSIRLARRTVPVPPAGPVEWQVIADDNAAQHFHVTSPFSE